MTIGFVGLGAMGAPMAARLVAAGLDVVVRDASPAAEAAMQAHGAQVADGATGFSTCSTVVTMLPNGRIVRDVLTGSDGIAPHLPPGCVVVDMSSAHPDDTIATGAALNGLGLSFIDAPVSGGVARAVAGTLAIMAGGDPAAIERVRPVLELLGSATVVGPLGSGHAIKALNNLLSATGLAAATEVLLVARHFGIEPATALAVLNASTGANNATQTKLGQFVLSRSFDSGFALDLQAKDLAIALDIAQSAGAHLQVTKATGDLVKAAHQALGPGRDHTEIARFIEERAGAELS